MCRVAYLVVSGSLSMVCTMGCVRTRVVALRPVQIKTSSSAYFTEEIAVGTCGTQTHRIRRSCGPLKFTFTPQGARKYSVEYAVSYAESPQGKCTQNVFDVTDPDKRIPVPAEDIRICQKIGVRRAMGVGLRTSALSQLANSKPLRPSRQISAFFYCGARPVLMTTS